MCNLLLNIFTLKTLTCNKLFPTATLKQLCSCNMHQGSASKIHRQQSYGNNMVQMFSGVCTFREYILKHYTADYHYLVSLASRFCLSSSRKQDGREDNAGIIILHGALLKNDTVPVILNAVQMQLYTSQPLSDNDPCSISYSLVYIFQRSRDLIKTLAWSVWREVFQITRYQCQFKWKYSYMSRLRL